MEKIDKSRVLSRLYLMQHTTRCGNLPVKIRQNIAEHSHGVAALCILVGNEVLSKLRATGTPAFLKVSAAVVQAVMHDYDETISLDFPLPLKRKLGNDIMFRIQEVIDEEAKGDFRAMGLDLERHKEEKTNVTPEYQLVKVCDYLELLFWSYNNRDQLGADYDIVVRNCKELIRTYDIHKYSSTVLQVLESEDFRFSYQ